jgi:hypothetical protein
MNFRKTLIAGSAAAAFGLLAGTAHADMPSCTDATIFPNPIYLTGSSAFEPTASYMAIKAAAATGNDKASIIYFPSGSCDGPKDIRDGLTIASQGFSVGDYWVPDTTNPDKPVKQNCTLDGAATIKADVGVSDIFYQNCPGNTATVPAGLVDTQGPVQAMLFIVPQANDTSTNLTAGEGQLIWGCGMSGGVTPFTLDTTATQQRDQNSGTQGIVAKAINVPPSAFKGKLNKTGGDLVTSLLAAPPDSAIGFLAADAYDTKRTTLNALAFQAFGQKKAYYADSTADSFDKRNVRDGHYVVWGPEHFFATADNTGHITNAKAASFIGWVNGTTTTTAFNFIDIEATAGVIPQCAMKVTRDQDGPPVKLYTPANPCGCYWESKATKTTPAGCMACTKDADCTGGKKCSNTFCE